MLLHVSVVLPVTPEHAKSPPTAETHHTTTGKQQNTLIEKETGVRHNTTKNSHQTNTQEDKDQSYITTALLDRQLTFKDNGI
jgi:hypothetical protein